MTDDDSDGPDSGDSSDSTEGTDSTESTDTDDTSDATESTDSTESTDADEDADTDESLDSTETVDDNESADADARSREDNGDLLTDTFFGGEGKPDGDGHGHVVADETGDIRYARDSEANMPGSTREERVSVDKPRQ